MIIVNYINRITGSSEATDKLPDYSPNYEIMLAIRYFIITEIHSNYDIQISLPKARVKKISKTRSFMRRKDLKLFYLENGEYNELTKE